MPIVVSALMGVFFLSGAAAAIPAQAQAPAAPALPSYTVGLTGYNAVPEQTDDDPLTTASGAYSNPEIIAARSQDMGGELPFGTIIEIIGPANEKAQEYCGYGSVSPLIGYRIIADTMNVRYHKRIDILFPTDANFNTPDGSQNASDILGNCLGAMVRVVGHVDAAHPEKFPKTQAALAKLVKGASSLAAK